MAHGRCSAAAGLLGQCHADRVTVRRIVLLIAFFVLVPPSAALAAECTGDPGEVRPISLTVAGEAATGLYTVPAGSAGARSVPAALSQTLVHPAARAPAIS